MGTEADGKYLQIGQVAERTELSLKTIRHYDEVGLVEPSARSAGGFRLYTEDDVEQMLVIRRMKPLGFTLEEMRELLSALDILDSEQATADQVAEARTYLLQCRNEASESQDRLRRQLVYAEEFTQLVDGSTSDRRRL